MNVLFVYAHDDPASFGASLHNRALSFFTKNGDTTVVSDLYASGFHAVAEKWDFKTSGGAHKNYMLEQKRVADSADDNAFAEDIKQEIAKVRNADLILFEFPIWWSAPPAIMKGWFDKVFALGVAWDGDHRYGSGLLRGKQALIIAGAGDSTDLYTPEGIHGATLIQHLYPLLHSTIAHSGIDVHQPFVAYGLTVAGDDDRRKYLEELDEYLKKVISSPEFIYKH